MVLLYRGKGGEKKEKRGVLIMDMWFVYLILDALLALYGDDSAIPIEGLIYGYIGSIRANYEGYTDKDSKG